MWHEARKQEKLIRGMIVDYRRRAERRKDFYEKIKADPTQFLQLHGRPCKIHLDPAVAMAGEGPAIMMQWQGDPDNLIDRFDVRAHLDFIPEVKFPEVPVEDLTQEERQCNYESYRILAQNAFLGINEDKFLQQLAIEEQFGVTLEEKEMQKEKLHERKGTGAAIGYNYNDPGSQPSSSNGSETKKVEKVEKIDKESDDDSDLDMLDVDLSIDVNKMEPSQAHDLNAVGPQFGMAGCDLFSFLTGDADDAEQQKQILREEKEKAMYSGRKSRRERRAHRDKKLATRVMSPPSYAAPAGPARVSPSRSHSRSASRSLSPEENDQIEFITEFGGDGDSTPPTKKASYSEKVKQNLKKLELYSEVARKKKSRSETEEYYRRPIGPRGPNSGSMSPTTLSSASPKSKSHSRSKSRSTSRSPAHKKSRSRSISRSSSSSRSSKSRSKSRSHDGSKLSRSPTNNSAKPNTSRSNSGESGSRAAAPPRYYGRRKEDRSSSELSFESGSSDSEAHKNSSVGNRSNTYQNQLRSSGSGSKGSTHQAMSLKEKLKKKMQAQLARQLRADKRVEAERVERESRRQLRRDLEMRDLALKLRRKQREMRHRIRSSEETDRTHSRSSSRDSGPPGALEQPPRCRTPERAAPAWVDNKHKPRPDEHPPYPHPPYDHPPPCNQPPYDRRRYQHQDYNQRNYYPENNGSSKSTSPGKAPNWEPRQAPYPYPDSRRNRYEEDERQENPRYENPRGYHGYNNRNEHYGDNRWNSRRRPYGHRGGYQGYNRPGPSGHNWPRDNQDYRNDRNKVKLVDY